MSTVASPELRRGWWWGFVPYAVVSAVHIIGNFFPGWAGDVPTKLALIPLLIVAVFWAVRALDLRGPQPRATILLLVIALMFSWLGDGAGTFLPWLPELPVMLASFGVTHLLYMWLFVKQVSVRRLPIWTLVYAVWWIVLVAILVPHAGSLAVAVGIYGIVLGGTATLAARCNPLIVWGAVLFLASDSVLAFRLFLPELMPLWTSPLVMLTYCAGQGLIAAGIVRQLAINAHTAQSLE